MTNPGRPVATIPVGSYRVQLRNGVDFAHVARQLPWLCDLGISHLYLSPIFQAMPGSTHGYDIADPTRIDDSLGGRAGFDALAGAASAAGIGIIIDIVPNHIAFSPDAPWLADVLRHGPDSRYAAHFDIDWQAGPLVLPFLPEPFPRMLEENAFRIEDGHWIVGDLRIPLAPGTEGGTDLAAIHEAQHWRLVHAEMERDGITHRRFFNVTGLIGVRVEDPHVFADTHALIFDLVRGGQVQGLRVDHIDGLADPAAYLDRLAAALPGTPVWVEKILVGEERLPPTWPTMGTTGYDAARLIARLLTDKAGLADLDAAWRRVTGDQPDFAEALRRAKMDVLDNELAAERRQLARLAGAACEGSSVAEPGPESLREAVTALLIAMPRYRTYVTAEGARDTGPDGDRALLSRLADTASEGLRTDTVVRLLAAILADPDTPAALAFAVRFQQVSGALLAKAQEDTAGFRWTRYLVANEVGAEPDEATITPAEADAVLASLPRTGMVLTSSHDTKRSEDSRMRLAAISHLPDDFSALVARAAALPQAEAVAPLWLWYVVQSALALTGADEAADRLAAHMEKAMREAKLTSFWTNPDLAAESAAQDLGRAVLADWQDHPDPALDRLLARAEALGLAQLGFKCLMPGFPDFYRGTETLFLALTDPDNRRPVDPDLLARAQDADDYGGEKLRWTRALLGLRRRHGPLLASAPATAARDDAGGVSLIRSGTGGTLAARIAPGPAPQDEVLGWTAADGWRVSITWSPSDAGAERPDASAARSKDGASGPGSGRPPPPG